MLLGLKLQNGWEVVQHLAPAAGATGSNFSTGYVVRRANGTKGFLKALDYVTRLARSDDQARDLQAMTEAFNFERDVLNSCRSMSRVVTAIEEGSVIVPGVMFGTVQYLIFELAEADARAQMDASAAFDVAWALRTLHHVAVGLFQMHRGGFAHQDVKPSNVLMFEKGQSAKVGDLGRAANRAHSGPFDGEMVAGDPSYAPPEMLYGEPPSSWNARRIGCDAYHLGSMVVFFFARTAMTPLLLNALDRTLWPAALRGGWGGTYADVLPKVRAGFDIAMCDIEAAIRLDLPEDSASDLVVVVRQLCEPDPALRGHPRDRRGTDTRLALERYVTTLDRLAKGAEMRLKKS